MSCLSRVVDHLLSRIDIGLVASGYEGVGYGRRPACVLTFQPALITCSFDTFNAPFILEILFDFGVKVLERFTLCYMCWAGWDAFGDLSPFFALDIYILFRLASPNYVSSCFIVFLTVKITILFAVEFSRFVQPPKTSVLIFNRIII